ncbi:MAG TPA: extracellular solute-binding protein [Candidatus Methylacidiphilales bacterium]|nr:extracellular solute-binding protein [Candidatus Methylacidiphilales bacterium]
MPMNVHEVVRGWIALVGAFIWVIALSAMADENGIVVISPHWDGIKEETARAFLAWHEKTYGQPVTIRWHEAGGGGSRIVKLLGAEYAAHPDIGIDVLYGGGFEPFEELEKDGLLTRYDPPAETLAQIPTELNGTPLIDPGHEWFGACLSGFGIITNERVRQAAGLPKVRTWADLADPHLAGWVSACDPRASSSVMQIYEIILQSYGWDKGWGVLMEMSGNTRNFLPSAAASAVEVGLGDAAYGVSIDVYGQAQAGYYGRGNVNFTLPTGRTVITPDAIAILKNPPHPELARHFLQFVLSREGQMLWMAPLGSPEGAKRYPINRMSVRPALYDELGGITPITTNPFKSPPAFVLSDQLGSKRRTILMALIASWMIDTHDVLVQAWAKLNSPAAEKLPAEHRQKLWAQFLAPPCSEQELLRLVDTDWQNPVKRTALANRWQAEALDRYENLIAQLAQ